MNININMKLALLKKMHNLKKKIDNEILRKGITTVIQHYLGVREKLDNYGLKKNLPN